LPAARRAIDDLRRAGDIGDGAFRLIEAELDWLELSAGSSQRSMNGSSTVN
jgi:CPA1 family monovalent cation:H+ antiporter